MRKLLTYILIAAAVLSLVVLFVVFRDEINEDTLGFLSRLIGGTAVSESGRITFDEGHDNLRELAGGYLTVLSSDRFALYGKDGTESVSRSVTLNTPALTVAGDKVIVFDRTGNTAFAADSSKIRTEFDFPVFLAAGNSRGQYILVTTESGYKNVALLYDKKDKLIYKWFSADSYIWAVALSPSGKRMAAASVEQRNETVNLRVTFLDTDSQNPLASVDIGDELPLGIFIPDNNHVCVVTESGVYFFSDDGLELGRYSFNGQLLLSAPIAAGEALFCRVGRNAGGQFSRLVCLSYTGSELGSVPLSESPTDLSAAGKTCAVLQSGLLTRYTVEGTSLKSEALGPCSANGLLVGDGGEILLLYSNYGEWYNEESSSIDRQGG